MNRRHIAVADLRMPGDRQWGSFVRPQRSSLRKPVGRTQDDMHVGCARRQQRALIYLSGAVCSGILTGGVRIADAEDVADFTDGASSS
jgi:hypothetical protein